MEKLHIRTKFRQDVIDLTPSIKNYLDKNKYISGILTVFSPHTTGAITVNENADPDVKKDMNTFLNKLVPQNSGFSHTEGNSDAHIKGSLISFSQTFIVENGALRLGTWQGIFFMEFDGPREREIWLKFISD
ncbi:MAG: secondary thiamine-phosphate synthase enzyme YjbQ [Candidatus Omnitrophica bacterium]|nr:secondary thiamine-phosphate synthase enzyme YjbQ [Candidatus Omnitrophota bacterium]